MVILFLLNSTQKKDEGSDGGAENVDTKLSKMNIEEESEIRQTRIHMARR